MLYVRIIELLHIRETVHIVCYIVQYYYNSHIYFPVLLLVLTHTFLAWLKSPLMPLKSLCTKHVIIKRINLEIYVCNTIIKIFLLCMCYEELICVVTHYSVQYYLFLYLHVCDIVKMPSLILESLYRICVSNEEFKCVVTH